MRITGPNSTTAAREGAASRRTSSGDGFHLPETSAAPPTTATAALRGASGIETLLALQGVEDFSARRRRMVGRGRRALDILDEIRLGFLAGRLDPALIGKLRGLSGELTEETGEPLLDRVLAEINLRLEVEIAKMSRPETPSAAR